MQEENLNNLLDPEFEFSLLKEIYNDSYYEFFKDAYRALKPNEIFSDNWHIKYLCDELQGIQYRVSNNIERDRDSIFNVPFRSAKSLITTVVWPVWCWTKDQSLSFISVSFSASLALEHAEMSRNLINSIWFRSIYGNLIEFSNSENSKGFYSIKGGGSRKAVGTGGQITGSGSSIIILDDPQDPKLAASVVERRNTIDFYKNTLYSRLNQPEIGHRLIVQQRLHENDLTGYLLDNHKRSYRHICIPAKLADNLSPKELEKYYINGLFWPNRFTEKVIQDFVDSLGSVQAAGQLQQKPAPEEGNMFKSIWFEVVDPSTIVRDPIKSPINFYIDTAESEESKEKGDSTAILAAFEMNNIEYICNVIELKKGFYDLVKEIPNIVRQNGYTENSMIKVEPKSSGKSLVSILRNETNLNIVELSSKPNSENIVGQKDKVTRASLITPKCESRKVKLLNGAYITNFINQLMLFPNASHDDMVDVFIYSVDDLLIGGQGFDFAFI